MIEFTKVIHRSEGEEADLPTVHLAIDARIKSRLRIQLDDGREAGLFLPRGQTLRDGDVIQSVDGEKVLVKAAQEHVSTAYAENGHLLARLAYHLGNRHVPLQVGDGWVRYQHDHVLDDMVSRLGGSVKAELAPFEPEDGAYGGHASGHHHAH